MNQHPRQTEIFERAAKVKLLVLDVDGVLTDGKLYFSDQGDAMKAFSTLDGHGIKLVQEFGIKVVIITGRQSDIVLKRAANLGIDKVVQGREDKLPALDALLKEYQLSHEECAYVGDDWPDLPCICRAGLGVTVPDAHPELKERAFCVTSYPGGKGAVRQVCDWLLQAQGHYDRALSTYF